MSDQNPVVSIGMPVFNGENYLESALTSLLKQTFTQFELIVSDNGSTDRTEEICRSCAGRDPRVRYLREAVNRGAAWNFNRVLKAARGEYFTWASHDDLWDSRFLEQCISVLKANPNLAACYCRHGLIDQHDRLTAEIPVEKGLDSDKIHHRYYKMLLNCPPQNLVLGAVLRTERLRTTGGLGNYAAADQVLNARIALLSPVKGVDEQLFYYRQHEEQSTGKSFPTQASRAAWFDPRNPKMALFTNWRLLREHVKAIQRSPMPLVSRMLCYLSVLRWAVRRRRGLMQDLSPSADAAAAAARTAANSR